jgi:N-acetylmuramoyl-L-alanine amidase
LSLIILVSAIFAAQVSGGATSKAVELLDKADQCRVALNQSSSKMKYRDNWLKCIKIYEEIYKSYPKSDQAPLAMFRAAGMYVGLLKYSGLMSDLDIGMKLYRRVVDEYSGHSVADDAQYKIGEIYYNNRKDPTQAYVEFLKVDIKFPSGDMRPKAREMMDKLSAELGKTVVAETVEAESSKDGKLVSVNNIRHWSTPTYTRVVIDLEKSVKYSSHLLKEDPSNEKPRRLYLDLENTFVGSGIDISIPIKDGLLQTARAGQYTEDTVRVVLDINNMEGYKTFHLYDPFRIVVDVSGKDIPSSETKTVAKTEQRAARKGIHIPDAPDPTVSLARQLGLSVKRIVIDPGHGGKDPGTYFNNGVKEKDIVLGMAKILEEKIRKEIGCEVFLTRTTDVFIPLDERTAFANVKKADLFLSLHINAHKQSDVFGVETYFLNMATDKMAVMVAARENATSEKNISDLQSILNDLMLNTKISESSKLAYEVQNGMMSGIKRTYKTAKSLGVKQAPFYVLIGAEMPAILIETGFITNPTERERLQSDKYRQILSDGIVTGVDTYIKSIELSYNGG